MTVVCHHQACLWGRVVDARMQLSAGGEMVAGTLAEVSVRYPGTVVAPSVVMPNHLHAVVTLPNPTSAIQPLLSDIMGWFKTVTTKRYIRSARTQGWPPFDGHVRHDSFHDHIIRDDDEQGTIERYIETDPLRWQEDRYHEPDTFDPLPPDDRLAGTVGKP